jgi:L-2-hydroxyglutarate oxidase LhgO
MADEVLGTFGAAREPSIGAFGAACEPSIGIVGAGIVGLAIARELTRRRPGPRIVPFRGEYLRVDNAKADLLQGLVYPVPEPGYPFLGVHFTRRTDGTVDIGPNAVLALATEGYRWRDLSPAHLARLAAWPGAWRMAARHWRMGAQEVYGSLSKRAYMKVSQRYFPSIGFEDVERDGAGVRAQALDRDGGLVDDFRVHRLGPVTAVRNAPSPRPPRRWRSPSTSFSSSIWAPTAYIRTTSFPKVCRRAKSVIACGPSSSV